MQFTVFSKPLNGGYLLAPGIQSKHQAGAYRPAVNQQHLDRLLDREVNYAGIGHCNTAHLYSLWLMSQLSFFRYIFYYYWTTSMEMPPKLRLGK
jgi:hypothetical protein